MTYAQRVKREDGTFNIETPGRGFTMINGLSESTAYAVETAINRAYAAGRSDVQQEIKTVLGIEDVD